MYPLLLILYFVASLALFCVGKSLTTWVKGIEINLSFLHQERGSDVCENNYSRHLSPFSRIDVLVILMAFFAHIYIKC